MDKQNLRLRELLNLYLNDTATDIEKAELWDYLENPLYTHELEVLLEESYQEDRQGPGISTLQQQMLLNNIFTSEQFNKNKSRTVALWPKIGIAVSIALVVFCATLFYYYHQNNPQAITGVNNLGPGKQSATLTLANGKKIRLSDALNGQLADEAGIIITKSADGQIIYEIKDNSSHSTDVNSLSTANGETYRIRLPDSSVVWLNSASRLTYNTALIKNGKRRVALTGEAYFEIAKDKAHPFVVSTDKQNVEVLGTHFNINSYPDEPVVTTTLLEGTVKVSSGQLSETLKPGQQASNYGHMIKIGKADLDNIMDWKDGGFDLDHQDFKSAMRKIARWYDLEVVYDSAVPDDLQSGGWISREEKLAAVLEAIASTEMVHFKMVGRKLYVTR